MLFEKISLEADEKVLLMVRKHWFVIIAELAAVGIAALAPFVLLLFFGWYGNSLEAATGTAIDLPGTLITFGLAAWLLLCTFSGFTIWTHYYLDLWIITDRRIISVDQVNFFSRNVAMFRLERLQDIEFKIQGLLATFLNFGTISAQTAGHHEHNFRATGMPDPRGLQALIQQAMDTRLTKLRLAPEDTE